MPTPKKSKPKADQAQGGTFDTKQRELRAQQDALETKINALQRTIAEAPARAAEERRRQQEAIVAASERRYLHGANLLDTRHVEAAAAAGRTRPSKGRKKPVVLRAERKADRLQTLALIIVLAFAIFWAISHFTPF